MSQYIRQLETVIAPAKLTVMDSSGGRLPAKEAILAPVKTALSGPAGGVRGAWEAGRLAGFNHVIGLDIGGTSTDVSIARGDLAPQVDGQVGDIPLRTPMLQIETVGAGGGSIAFVDPGGALKSALNLRDRFQDPLPMVALAPRLRQPLPMPMSS